MPTLLNKKSVNDTAKKPAQKKKQVSNVHKLKMLVTIVDRSKTLFYADLLEQFEVNVQMILYGKGTANSQMIALLGILIFRRELYYVIKVYGFYLGNSEGVTS